MGRCAGVVEAWKSALSASRLAEQRRLQAEQDARLAAEEAERRRLAKIVDFKRKFEESLDRKDFDTAVRYVESLRSVNASAPVLSELEGRLSGARVAERRRQEDREWHGARLAAEEAERRRQAKNRAV